MTSFLQVLPPLVAVLIGGILTLAGQWLTTSLTTRSSERMTWRRLDRERQKDEEQAIQAVVDKVAADVVGLLRAYDPEAPLDHSRPGDVLEHEGLVASRRAKELIRDSRIDAGALTVRLDPKVAAAVHAVYECWFAYFDLIEEAVTVGNVFAEHLEPVTDDALNAHENLVDVARARRETLDAREK